MLKKENLPKIEIINGEIILDGKKFDSIIEYVIKNSYETGMELTIKMLVRS